MHLQRVQLYIKSDVFPLLNDLLHLLMKFAAVRSVRVGENNDTKPCLGITHDKGVFKGYL